MTSSSRDDPTLEPWTGPPDRPVSHRLVGARPLLGALVLLVGLVGTALVVATGRQDSALLFVGVPVTLAMGVTLLARPRTGGGLAFAVTTIVLLLVSALLQEAAVCVLLAAPLVYGVTGLAVAFARSDDGDRRYAVAPLLLLALSAGEGTASGARVVPVQSTTVSTHVGAGCDTVADRLAHPALDASADRGTLLRLFPYPTPTAASGSGLEVGDTWELAMPQAPIRTRVTAADARHVVFAVTQDHSRATRWVRVQEGSIAWDPEGDGCRATLEVSWERRLDPSWYFGPVDQVFFTAGAEAFLRQLTGPSSAT